MNDEAAIITLRTDGFKVLKTHGEGCISLKCEPWLLHKAFEMFGDAGYEMEIAVMNKRKIEKDTEQA